jgi:hypothetical protein
MPSMNPVGWDDIADVPPDIGHADPDNAARTKHTVGVRQEIYDPNDSVSLMGQNSINIRRPYLYCNAPAAITMFALPGGEVVEQMTLTGAITLNNGGTRRKGAVRVLYQTQDGVGGRTTTFGTQYKTNYTPDTTAGKRNILALTGDGASWVQLYASTGLPA